MRAGDGRPPAAVLAVMNPIMRAVLRTPVGRLVKPMALLEFTGRKSGRRIRVTVGWHEVDGGRAVFTPAAWRANFAGGAPATVHYLGRRHALTGTLITDPHAVAAALASVIAGGTPPRMVGIDLPAGHTLAAEDVASLDRAMIRFT